MRPQHNYNCKASKWEGSGNFVELMKTDLKAELALVTNVRSAAWWDAYVDAKPVWVTETKCAPHSNQHTTHAHQPTLRRLNNFLSWLRSSIAATGHD